MQSTSIKLPELLPLPLKQAEGELQFCLQNNSPIECYRRQYEPSTNITRYSLTQYDAPQVSAGNAGSLLVWEMGETQTYFKIEPPLYPERPESIAYVLNKEFQHRGQWPNFLPVTDRSFRFVAKVMDHIIFSPTEILNFDVEIPQVVVIEYTKAIKCILASALEKPLEQEINQRINPVVESALYSWVRLSHRGTPMRSWDDLKQKVKYALYEEPCIRQLTSSQQMQYGFGDIRSLVEECIQYTFKARTEFQDRMIGIFLQQISHYSVRTASRPNKTGQSVSTNALDKESKKISQLNNLEKKLFQLWDNDIKVKDIAKELNISQSVVNNYISRLRRELGSDIVKYRGSHKNIHVISPKNKSDIT